eukprot:scaffold7351_cov259-Pinguiococcus_pyrenoidosus.AAC.11
MAERRQGSDENHLRSARRHLEVAEESPGPKRIWPQDACSLLFASPESSMNSLVSILLRFASGFSATSLRAAGASEAGRTASLLDAVASAAGASESDGGSPLLDAVSCADALRIHESVFQQAAADGADGADEA